MVICPKCKSEIDSLNVYSKCRQTFDTENGYGEIESLELSNEEFVCPMCGAVLFTDNDEAKKFLEGYIGKYEYGLIFAGGISPHNYTERLTEAIIGVEAMFNSVKTDELPKLVEGYIMKNIKGEDFGAFLRYDARTNEWSVEVDG